MENIPNGFTIKRNNINISFSKPYLNETGSLLFKAVDGLDLPLHKKTIVYQNKDIEFLDNPIFRLNESKKGIEIKYGKIGLLMYLDEKEFFAAFDIKNAIKKDLLSFQKSIELNTENILINTSKDFIATRYLIDYAQEYSMKYYNCLVYLYQKYTKLKYSYSEIIEKISKVDLSKLNQVVLGNDIFYETSFHTFVTL